MLKKLKVKNFAIIEDITINFKSNMTVLTGQTGAGKSLLIDSISLLLGSRADKDMIRYGANEALVYAEFDYTNAKINDLLDYYNINKLTNIIIERKISKSKSSIKINNQNVNLQILNQITIYLADLHSQQDTFRLFNKDNYISFIDFKDDISLADLLNNYTVARAKYLNDYKRLNDILNKSKKTKENYEYLVFAYKEISSLELCEGLDKDIEDKINKLKNYDKIFSNLKDAYQKLDNEYFNLDSIYEAFESINSISKYDDNFKDIANDLKESYDCATSSLDNINQTLSNMEYNPDELDNLNIKLNEIENLELKYHKSFDQLLKYQDELKLEIDLTNNYDSVIKNEEDKLKKSFESTLKCAQKLSDYRKNISKDVSKAIEKECYDLDLKNARFEIKFDEVNIDDYHNKDLFLENGIDQIDFLVSLNLGEPLKPLSKVASGGEMSRIMLAFKTYFASKSNLSLIVFDEIDTGVSGEVATQIALKMKSITQYAQVLAISHLPQVAGMADNQLFIYKEESLDRTITKVKELNNDERVITIAKMISGEHVSSSSLETAKEMLKK